MYYIKCAKPAQTEGACGPVYWEDPGSQITWEHREDTKKYHLYLKKHIHMHDSQTTSHA